MLHVRQAHEELARRRLVERDLVRNDSAFTVSGWCVVCQKQVDLYVDFISGYPVDGRLSPNWREKLRCPRCGLNNRMRAAVHIFEQEFLPSFSSSIYITEQITPLFRVLRQRYCRLLGSEYLNGRVPFGGNDRNGVRNENVTNLTFASEAFDFALSFDVFEHVPEYWKGFAECFRCLRPGGRFLFSVPFSTKRDTVARARRVDEDKVVHLLPPEYHGDPLSQTGCLCFYNFGWDILNSLEQAGFRAGSAVIYWSREFCYLGHGEQLMFLAQKPSSND
jgi:SAM-dependent methyltransferase